MMTDIKESHYSNDIEKSGYLQKKTSKGLWVNRYFVTETNYLYYWHEMTDYEMKKPACEKYDISEIKNLEKSSSHGITMNFMENTKFKLEIRASQVTERNEWFNIIDAKKRLYSVDELLSDLRSDRISFRTKNFQTLMTLQEKDQNKWILDRLDESFETSSNDTNLAAQLRSNSNRLLLAANRAMDEFIQTCQDCDQEMASREPKVMAHTRYTDILKGRLTLELLYLPGIEKKQFEHLEERALCTALLLSDKVESLTKFSFISREFIDTLSKTLFTSGDLITALIKLSAHRMDAFFETILSSSIDIRSRKLMEMKSVINEFISLVRDDLTDENLFRMVIQKVITTQLLAFADHLTLFDLQSYNESAIVDHVHACQNIYQDLSHTYVDLHTRQLCYDETMTAHTAMTISQRILSTPEGIRRNSISNNSNINSNKYSSVRDPMKSIVADRSNSITGGSNSPIVLHSYFIPKDLLELIHTTTEASCRSAIRKAINDLEIGRQYLLKGLLQESAEGWIGGVICMALIHNLHQWLDTFRSLLPEKYAYSLPVEIGQVMIMMYLKKLIEFYRTNRSDIILTKRGIQQLKQDFECIHHWILQNASSASASNGIGSSLAAATLPAPNQVNREEARSEKEFLQMLQSFLLCTDATALKNYADAVLVFGIKYKYHIYDLLRLILKIRSDISTKVRKAILGVSSEFCQQLEEAISTDPKLLEGTIGNSCVILEELCPLVGIEHCTGMKWKLETPADPTAIRLTISLTMTQIINQAVVMKKQKYGIQVTSMKTVEELVKNNGESATYEEEVKDQGQRVDSPPVKPIRSSQRFVSPQTTRKSLTAEEISRTDPEVVLVTEPTGSGIASRQDHKPEAVDQMQFRMRKPPQPPPPPPRNKGITVQPPEEVKAIENFQPEPLVVADQLPKIEKMSSGNPFAEDEDNINHSTTAATATTVFLSNEVTSSKSLPPPKPQRRKSNTESPQSHPMLASKSVDSVHDLTASSQDPPSRSTAFPPKPAKPTSRTNSPALMPIVNARAMSPQDALNRLLANAQKNLADQLDYDEKN